MWVFDATPLIYLAKVERLPLVSEVDDRAVIPAEVYEEVVEAGVEYGYPDARRVERSVENGVLEVLEVATTAFASRIRQNPNLSDADVAALTCAADHDAVAVIDETHGRDVAASEGITTRGTAYLVLLWASQEVIGVDEARSVIDGMVEEGWYCAPDVYARIVRTLDSFSN